MSDVQIDWAGLLGHVVEMPPGTTFWRGIGHPPESLGEGDTLRPFSWLSTVRTEASAYAKLKKDAPGDRGPWICEYVNERPLRVLSLVSEDGSPRAPKFRGIRDIYEPDVMAGLAARGVDLILQGERGFYATKLGYFDHVRPLRPGVLSFVAAHETNPGIEHRHFIEALRKVDPADAEAIEGWSMRAGP